MKYEAGSPGHLRLSNESIYHEFIRPVHSWNQSFFKIMGPEKISKPFFKFMAYLVEPKKKTMWILFSK